jgi:hypothetical protein
MSGPYGGKDPTSFQRSLREESISDSKSARIQMLDSELCDLKKVYEIAMNIIGLSPSQQRAQGMHYRSYLSKEEWPSVRELVQRLLEIPDGKDASPGGGAVK